MRQTGRKTKAKVADRGTSGKGRQNAEERRE
jgi:hypothetical protein